MLQDFLQDFFHHISFFQRYMNYLEMLLSNGNKEKQVRLIVHKVFLALGLRAQEIFICCVDI